MPHTENNNKDQQSKVFRKNPNGAVPGIRTNFDECSHKHKKQCFILSQTETLFLLVNFSRYFNKQALQTPQLWVLTLDHIPICGLLGHIYILPQISSLKNALEQTNTTQG